MLLIWKNKQIHITYMEKPSKSMSLIWKNLANPCHLYGKTKQIHVTYMEKQANPYHLYGKI